MTISMQIQHYSDFQGTPYVTISIQYGTRIMATVLEDTQNSFCKLVLEIIPRVPCQAVKKNHSKGDYWVSEVDSGTIVGITGTISV